MADNNVVITFTFNAEGQSGVLSAVDAINDRIKQGQEAQSRGTETGTPEGGNGQLALPTSAVSEHIATGQAHLPDPKEAKEFGASIETANKSMEVLVHGVESFARILTTGRLNVAVGGFNQIGESIKGVAAGFGEAGIAIGFMATAITTAIATAGAAGLVIKELGEHSAEAVNSFHELANVAGLSSEKFAALQTNFAQFGVGMETVQRLVRLTSVRIQEEWGSLVHAQRTAADDSIKLNLDVNEAQRREQEAQSQARLAPFGEVEAQERLEETRAQERLAPLGVFRAEESVQESQARQRFGPHGIAHAEANLEEAQLAIPKGELTTEGAKTSLLQAQLNYNKIFGTVDHPVQEKHFTPGSNEDLAYQIQRRQAEEGLKQAQFQEKSAEIKERETKSVEGGIPEAEEALRKAHFQERVSPLETEEAQEGLRKAQFQQEEAAPHAVMEADEGLLKAKRDEAAASDEVAKAAIGVRAAFLALREFPLKNAPALAAAIGSGGAGIPWAQVLGSDIFRALTIRGVNPATGVPDLQGVLKQVTQFYNLPGVPQAAKADLGAEITGGRGTGLAQVIAALTEQSKNKEGIFEETDRSRGLAVTMDRFKEPAEELRTVQANAGIDQERALVIGGGPLMHAAGEIDKGVAAGITGAANLAADSLHLAAEGANLLSDGERSAASAATNFADTLNRLAGVHTGPDGNPVQEGGSLANIGTAIAGAIHDATVAFIKGGLPDNAGGHADGGYITGPGTGTSDSIRAPWLSNGEYVIKAARVAQVGKDKLDDLNEGRVGFADGGLVLTDDGQPWASDAKPAPPPSADSGYWLPKIFGGIWNSLKSGATLPGDVATGKAHTYDANFASRVVDMTGLVTGGSSFGEAPAGALRVGAARAAEKRDIIPQAAREKGFDIVGYHATRRDIKDFSNPEGTYRGLTFFGSTPERAKQGMFGGEADLSGIAYLPEDKRPITTLPAYLRNQDIEGLSWTPAEKAWHAGLPDTITSSQEDSRLQDLMASKPKHSGISHWDDVYNFSSKDIEGRDISKMLDQGFPADKIEAQYTKKPIPTHSYEEAQKTNRDIYGQMFPGYNEAGSADQSSAQRAIAKGMSGFIVSDEAGLSIAHAQPHLKDRLTQPKDWPSVEPPKGIVAYHGSPHDFDKFSTANIGTGEGAQAYGHGLYFAESEGVARSYREGLAGKPIPATMQWEGAPAFDKTIKNELDPSIKNGIYELHGRLSNYTDPSKPELIERTKTNLANTIKNYESGAIPMDSSHYQAAKDAHAVINDPRFSVASAATPGHMYQVRINAEPEHFLDWDKPLSEQHPKVQDAYNARVSPGLKTREIGNNPNLGPMFDVVHPSGGTIGTFTKDNLQDILSNPAKYVPTSGKDFYEELERHYGRGSLTAGKKDATDVLHEAGIPGIKYLDQGSRTVLPDPELVRRADDIDRQIGNAKKQIGTLPADMREEYQGHIENLTRERAAIQRKLEPSRNYVVFDDKLVNIENKYALGGLVNYADGGPVDEDYHRLRHWHKAHHKPIETIQVPRDRRTDEQIRANYADNLNVKLENPLPTRVRVVHPGESRWAQAIPEEDRPRFARALDADRRAEARRALGLSPPPLGDAAAGSMPWGTTTHEYAGEHDARERRARGDFQTDAQFAASPAYEGRATGGLIQGPGTSTSDSIQAPWVSNGEYVIKADRVAQVGVDKMHDFNEGRIGFAAGGYIPAVNGMVPSPFTSPAPPSGGFLLQAVSQIGQEKAAFASGAMLGNISPLQASNLVGSSSPSSSAFSGHYTLDVTTDKGVVPVMMTEDMMLSLSQSALASKLTRTGITPTWGS